MTDTEGEASRVAAEAQAAADHWTRMHAAQVKVNTHLQAKINKLTAVDGPGALFGWLRGWLAQNEPNLAALAEALVRECAKVGKPLEHFELEPSTPSAPNVQPSPKPTSRPALRKVTRARNSSRP